MFRKARLRLTLIYAGSFFGMLIVLGTIAWFAFTRSVDAQVDHSLTNIAKEVRIVAAAAARPGGAGPGQGRPPPVEAAAIGTGAAASVPESSDTGVPVSQSQPSIAANPPRAAPGTGQANQRGPGGGPGYDSQSDSAAIEGLRPPQLEAAPGLRLLTGGQPPPAPTVSVAPAAASAFFWVLDLDGQVQINHQNVDATGFLDLEVTNRARQGEIAWETFVHDGERFRVLAEPILANGEVFQVVLAVRSLADRDDQVRAITVILLLTAGGGLLTTVALGHFLAGRALRPISVAYDRQRAFVADASHELRAPITVIRTSSDLLLEEPLNAEQRASVEEIRDVADEASELVTGLLELARLQRPPARQGDPVDIARAAREECDTLQPLLDRHRTRLTLDLGPARSQMSALEVKRVVRALIENVVAHTPDGTSARVSTWQQDRTAHLIVEDGGPGVPRGAIGSIFERFTKGASARTAGMGEGYGLGLAIVSEIARRSGGDVRASISPLGGLRVAVSVPQASR